MAQYHLRKTSLSTMFGLILSISLLSSTCLVKAVPTSAQAVPATSSIAPEPFLNVTQLSACVPPSIRITVVSSGNVNTQLSVPLFTDCTYQKTTPVTPGQNNAPSSAISSSADYSQYVDANGNPLDKNSVNTFLEFFGDSVDLDVILEQTACAITDTSNNVDTIQSDNETLNNGASVNVLNYQCITELIDA
ncbi:hypothetical protein L207DRAFT_137391 [Hyaloscypha variabilis F]|uniref:Uncharacterized protein n=1 Tax=Hyaloscypha variabilis (strain UAMH 11265 / GT02V1 / F) TaxID=1149755 RepID=A0A2J6R6N3_HYAVF|nr:hypothetical protein L207DRAFT_137391 [Hyaloscypha variabilis F]